MPSGPSEYQAQFTGPEDDYDLALGSIYAIRSFAIFQRPRFRSKEELPTIVPVTSPTTFREQVQELNRKKAGIDYLLKGHWDQVWPDGEFVARCLRYVPTRDINVAITELSRIFNLYDLNYLEKRTFLGLGKVYSLEAWNRVHPEFENIRPIKSAASDITGFPVYYYLNPCNDQIPFQNCTCGFYGMYDVPARSYINAITAVVQHYGKTLIGTKGVRSKQARLTAIAIPEKPISIYNPEQVYLTGVYREDVLAGLTASYPSVEILTSSNALHEMVEKYPPTRP